MGHRLVNLVAVGDAIQDDRYGALVLAKIVAVAASGITAWLFLTATTRRGIRTGAAASVVFALAVLYAGVILGHE